MASPNLATATAIALVFYTLLLLFFVIKGAKQTKNLSDYAVGSKRFSPVLVGFALAGSLTSAATFIINPGFIALYGISGLLTFGLAVPAGIFFSLIVLTKSFRKYGKSTNALTMAEWIGKQYNSKPFALFFAFLSLLLISFMVLLCVGMTKVLAKALNAEEFWVLLGIVVIVFGYMMFGGANSIVYTNSVQVLFMIVVAIILLTSGYEQISNGISEFLDKLAAIDPDLVAPKNVNSPLFRDYFEIFFCNFVIGVAAICQPHIITRSLILKKEKDVNIYLFTAMAVLTLFFTVIISGLYARLSFPYLQAGSVDLKMDGIIPAYVVREFSSAVGLILVLGLLSASLSTLENLIQSIPTSITQDIIKPLFGYKSGAGTKQGGRLIYINKMVIAVLAITTLLLSYWQLVDPDLSVGIFAQLGVYAYFSAAIVPVLFGIFLKNVPIAVPLTASIVALLVYVIIYFGRVGWYMQVEIRNPAIAGTFAILASLLVGSVLYFVVRKKQDSLNQAL